MQYPLLSPSFSSRDFELTVPIVQGARLFWAVHTPSPDVFKQVAQVGWQPGEHVAVCSSRAGM